MIVFIIQQHLNEHRLGLSFEILSDRSEKSATVSVLCTTSPGLPAESSVCQLPRRKGCVDINYLSTLCSDLLIE